MILSSVRLLSLPRSIICGGELESFANSPLPEDAASSEIKKARKLLRGLLRTWNVGSGDLKIKIKRTDNPGIVTSPPGLFVVDLLPLLGGGFDREQVMKIPVVAWEFDSGGDAKPVIPGAPVIDRWAVLTPSGFVISDYCTGLGYEATPVALKDWIKNEVEWVEDPRSEPYDFWTASQKAFEYSGPLPRAIWFMMAGRRDWAGTPEEMLEALSKFRDHTDTTGWPLGTAAFAAALKELEPILAAAGLLIARTDDGRLLIDRRSGDSAGGDPLFSTPQ